MLKRGWYLIGAAMVLIILGTEDSKAEKTMEGSEYFGHARQVTVMPFSQGTSYYEYQWGLKNKGNFVAKREKEVLTGAKTGPGESSIYVNGGDTQSQPDKSEIRSVAGADINIEAAWNFYEQCGVRRQVTVALIDTGVDISHPELSGSVWVNEDEIPGDGIDNDQNGYIDDIHGWNFYDDTGQIFGGSEDDHGTHGAGTIAAAWDGQGIVGIADGNYVKIMVLKVLGSREGRGVSSGVKKAIRYAQDNGAAICNLSMGSLTYDRELEEIIRNSPMLFVISAGNGDASGKGYSIDELPMYPASCQTENIITVGSMLFDGSLDDSSNYGSVSVDIAAPGINILSAVPGGYGFMSGTSMAAPMVTGTAALVWSCRTDLDMAGVRQAILNTARPVESMQGKTVTGGVIDAYGAVTYGWGPF